MLQLPLIKCQKINTATNQRQHLYYKRVLLSAATIQCIKKLLYLEEHNIMTYYALAPRVHNI